MMKTIKMKLSDIEALLNLPYQADIDIWSVHLSTITEVARTYNVEPLTSESNQNTWIQLSSDSVSLILNTAEKVKTNYQF